MPPSKLRLLQDYAISRNGFLPQQEPSKRLTDPYYMPWESALDSLPLLIRERSVRTVVDEMSILTTCKLQTEEEWRRAYVVLSFLAHAYIWGGEEASEILPPMISAPFLQVSEHLNLPPVATYAALNLWNFTCDGRDFRDLDKLTALHTFSGTVDESWFFSVSVAMEAQGAYIIPVMLEALEAVPRRDYHIIVKALDELTVCIEKLAHLLGRMDEKCDPLVFYHQIRPYLAGSKNMGAAGLPNGVLYQDIHGTRSWMQLRGGSNGQSSLIQFLDAVLGVEHASSGSGTRTSRPATKSSSAGEEATPFHEEVRSYMPAPHRLFLEHVSHARGIKELVNELGDSEEQRRLRHAFQVAVKSLGDFRNKHMQMVTRYIIVPSRRQCRVSAVNPATTPSRSERDLGAGPIGTGGTALIPFLRQTRDETYLTGTSRTPRVDAICN
ncbi:hypothetical protein M426DRAFT_61448 [Hypoxylon sp. CI-4A]|nr:hypothetical protein M426DRAFT_61448 [Hypoxylon sp. CI-4A]